MMIPTGFSTLLATAAGGAPSGPFGLPDQSSTVAPTIDDVFSLITWICIFFFVLIVVLMVIFIVKYSKPPGTPAESQTTHNTPMEVTWTIIPLLLVIFIFYKGMQGYINISSAPLGAYEINVVGQKWNWTFNYKNGASTSDLLVPVGKPVKLLMSSQDVLHSLYIPGFRVKQDVVPGRITTLWFEATEVGEFDLYCAEYCGTQHSTMLAKVIVYEESDFESALAEAANWPELVPADRLYVGGPRLYSRCKSCHRLDDTTSTGPGWLNLWENSVNGTTVFTDGTTLADQVGDGKLFLNPEDYIMQSITNPKQKVVMNFSNAMPSFQGQLDPIEIMILTDFIKNLDLFDVDGNPLDPADDLQTIIEAAKAAQEAAADDE